LVDAVLSVEELADHAGRARSWGTVGGEGELAVIGQHVLLSGKREE